MRQFTTTKTNKIIEETTLARIICNQCGAECEASETLTINHRWGYGSKFDTECHGFDLCEACYEKLIQGFQVPVEIEE